MSSRAIARQGSADGLCGIYCLVNSIRHWSYLGDDCLSWQQDALHYLLEAAERLGLLTANRIVTGFHWHELVEVFNHFAERVDLNTRALPLSRYAKGFECVPSIGFLRGSVERGDKVIVSVNAGRHWVLANKVVNGEVFADDPQTGQRRKLGIFNDVDSGLVITQTDVGQA